MDEALTHESEDFNLTLTDAQRARIWETNYGRDLGWVLECSGEPIALLTEPESVDMFWVSYRLTPVTKDPQVLSKLYTEDFWNEMHEFVFRSQELGIIAPHAFPGGFELPRTGRVSMRALYIDIGPPPQPARPIKLVLWLRSIFRK